MALDVRKFGPKSDKIGAHRGAFVYQEPFKKDASTASRVINEVVLEGEFCELRLTEFYEVRLSGSAKYTRSPSTLSQSVLRIGSHSVPFRGSAIVPTIFYFLSRALKR